MLVMSVAPGVGQEIDGESGRRCKTELCQEC
jgi:hypothetical protein